MAQRKSTSTRPYGTDGSDFSYRMVVDPRYTKVAEGKSRLKKLVITQAAIQLIGVLCIFLLSPKKESIDRLAMYSIISGFLSLLIGDIGRKKSQINFLRLYMIGSSAATLLSIVCIVRNDIFLEAQLGNYKSIEQVCASGNVRVIQGSSGWATKKFEVVEASRVLLGVPLEIVAITTTMSLVQNMSPPRRT